MADLPERPADEEACGGGDGRSGCGQTGGSTEGQYTETAGGQYLVTDARARIHKPCLVTEKGVAKNGLINSSSCTHRLFLTGNY